MGENGKIPVRKRIDFFEQLSETKHNKVVATASKEASETEKPRMEQLQNNTIEQPEQNKFDIAQTCRPNRSVDDVDSDELNESKDQAKFAAETYVAERNKTYISTLDNIILVRHADEKTVIIPIDIKTDGKDFIISGLNEKESFESQHDIKSNKSANIDLGKDRQAKDSDEVVVDKTQLKSSHLEMAMAETDKQTGGHEARSLKLPPKEIDKEAARGLTESKRNPQTEDAEIARHNENDDDDGDDDDDDDDDNDKDDDDDDENQRRRTTDNTFEDGISKTKNLERNLDSATHENEQCIHDSVDQLSVDGAEPELAEKSDTVHHQSGKTNQVNQSLDSRDVLPRESDPGNTQKSENANGGNVEIIKEVYFAENKLHEIKLSTKRGYQDVKANPDDVNSEKRWPEERHVKTETKISSMVSDTLSEKKDKILCVRPRDNTSTAIWGVAKITAELFLLRDTSLSSEVWLLKEESFEYLWKLRGRPLDMAGDSINQYLYICRCIKKDNHDKEIMISVHTLNESQRPSETPKHNWVAKFDRYVTLSITSESNVLLTLMERRKLIEYTYNGVVEKVLREIEITDLANPLHAVKQSKETYVVCHGENRDKKHRVCIVNASGHLLKDFCLKTNFEKNMSVVPMYLALGKGGSIIVAENRNGRVVQLNADLTAGDVLLTIKNDGLGGPCRLLLDKAGGEIIVAYNEHGWQDGKLFIRDI